jgi:hypothetical protein
MGVFDQHANRRHATSFTPVAMAIVLASVTAIRRPVNEPGPTDTYSSSTSRGVHDCARVIRR